MVQQQNVVKREKKEKCVKYKAHPNTMVKNVPKTGQYLVVVKYHMENATVMVMNWMVVASVAVHVAHWANSETCVAYAMGQMIVW